jgi:Multimeric flavodoxin WrbA
MKVLGISYGRKMKNTEILVKQALMAAEQKGAQVEFIRMYDLNIKPCTGCNGCIEGLLRGGNGYCVINDDLKFVDEHILDADAVIIGSPVYVLTPSGLFKDVCDRYGPARDYAFKNEENEARKKAGKTGKDLIDERVFKPRFCAFITVGGATTQNWLSLGMPLMNLFAISQHLKVVDQMEARGMLQYGTVFGHEQYLDRATKLGENIADCLGKTRESVQWMGDEVGTCPVCHSNLLTVGSQNPVECPICGIYGTIDVKDGKISVVFSEAEQKRSRLNYEGKLEHYTEIIKRPPEILKEWETGVKKAESMQEKYKGYKEI